MKNILVTDFENSGEDVMIFSNKETEETVKAKLDGKNKTYDEIYEVKDIDVQYYIYDPCYLKD